MDEIIATPRFGVIIPACNEEACLGRVLAELGGVLAPWQYVLAVGVNGSRDRTAQIAREAGVIVGETRQRGYGHGCMAAIAAVKARCPSVEAYIFLAGDGASHPRDVRLLTAAFDHGHAMVLGARTTRLSNWRAMGFSHVLANVSLGCWCGLLTGRWFRDLAPLRLIERRLFEAIAPQELTFGWTIEAQIGAAILGASICEVTVGERRRLAGEQKVSGVRWRQTFTIGCHILAAGWRARRRFRERSLVPAGSEILAESQRA